ncbi:MAG: PAS domain-containing protein, partial [Rhodospirillales bacterium]|nr:PAS domain-containing protein [Rhodospirillales bacterium]
MQYGPVCKLIAGLLPGQVEVVLHDMKTNKIAAIEGGFSNRDIGDESLIDIQDLAKDVDGIDVLGPYPQQNWDGETLRSFTAVLRDENGDCIGLLCVNCRTSAFVAAAEAL